MSNTDKLRRSRFSEAGWLTDKKHAITIGGLGGIGSWVAFLISRSIHPLKLLLYDMDTVSGVNLGGQFYSDLDVDSTKTDACCKKIYEYSSMYDIMTFEKFIVSSLVTDICISAFDNMQARKDMFSTWKQRVSNRDVDSIFIDGRLLAEYYQVYFVTPNRIEEYEKTLFSDDEVEKENCAFKQTTHFATMIASKMVQGLTNWMVNVNTKSNIREVPFSITEVGPLFHVETKIMEEAK